MSLTNFSRLLIFLCSFDSLHSIALSLFLGQNALFFSSLWSWLQSDSVQPEIVSSLMLFLLQVMLSCSSRRRVRSRPSLTPASRRTGNSTCVSRAPLLKINQWVKHCHSPLWTCHPEKFFSSLSRRKHCSEEIRFLNEIMCVCVCVYIYIYIYLYIYIYIYISNFFFFLYFIYIYLSRMSVYHAYMCEWSSSMSNEARVIIIWI